MFNLFRQTEDPDIVCALPDGGRLPDFLRGQVWSYGGKVEDIRAEQSVFDRPSVQGVIARHGFYIYTRL